MRIREGNREVFSQSAPKLKHMEAKKESEVKEESKTEDEKFEDVEYASLMDEDNGIFFEKI